MVSRINSIPSKAVPECWFCHTLHFANLQTLYSQTKEKQYRHFDRLLFCKITIVEIIYLMLVCFTCRLVPLRVNISARLVRWFLSASRTWSTVRGRTETRDVTADWWTTLSSISKRMAESTPRSLTRMKQKWEGFTDEPRYKKKRRIGSSIDLGYEILLHSFDWSMYESLGCFLK